MKVKEIMSCPVETISSDATITQAAEMMKSLDIGILPVKHQDKVVGMITDRDIAVRIVAEKLDPQSTSVHKAMTPEPVCCSEDTDIQEAAEMMEEKKLHRLLVLSSDNEPVGVLSTGDIARKANDEHLLCEVLQKICEPANVY